MGTSPTVDRHTSEYPHYLLYLVVGVMAWKLMQAVSDGGTSVTYQTTVLTVCIDAHVDEKRYKIHHEHPCT